MDINTASSKPPLPTLTLTPAAILRSALPPAGSQLMARVTAVPQPGIAQLVIDGKAITAQTSATLQAGQHLRLLVSQLTPVVVLKVLAPSSPATALAPDAWRANLPRQLPQGEILANLPLVARPAPDSRVLLPPSLQQLARQLLDNLPQARALGSADTLKQALQLAGPFLERALLRQGPDRAGTVTRDWKAGLLRLRAALAGVLDRSGATAAPPPPRLRRQPAPPLPGTTPQAPARATASLPRLSLLSEAVGELLHQTEGALARIQLHQLQSLAELDAGRYSWSLELPLRRGDEVDLVDLLIKRHAADSAEDEAVFTVQLALDLPELGPIHIRLSLAKDCIQVAFWAQQAATVALIRASQDTLCTKLGGPERRARVDCYRGSPPASAPSRTHPLLDLRV